MKNKIVFMIKIRSFSKMRKFEKLSIETQQLTDSI